VNQSSVLKSIIKIILNSRSNLTFWEDGKDRFQNLAARTELIKTFTPRGFLNFKVRIMQMPCSFLREFGALILKFFILDQCRHAVSILQMYRASSLWCSNKGLSHKLWAKLSPKTLYIKPEWSKRISCSRHSTLSKIFKIQWILLMKKWYWILGYDDMMV